MLRVVEFVASAIVLFVVPLVLWSWGTPGIRRVAWRAAAVYLVVLLAASLALPLATGVARWQSDVLDDSFRAGDYVPYVVPGVLLLRSGVAAGLGVALAAVARGRSLLSIGLSALLPVSVEAVTLLAWLPEWLGNVAAFVANGLTAPEWALPMQVTLSVGLSYFGPPLVAGLVAGGCVRRIQGTAGALENGTG